MLIIFYRFSPSLSTELYLCVCVQCACMCILLHILCNYVYFPPILGAADSVLAQLMAWLNSIPRNTNWQRRCNWKFDINRLNWMVGIQKFAILWKLFDRSWNGFSSSVRKSKTKTKSSTKIGDFDCRRLHWIQTKYCLLICKCTASAHCIHLRFAHLKQNKKNMHKHSKCYWCFAMQCNAMRCYFSLFSLCLHFFTIFAAARLLPKHFLVGNVRFVLLWKTWAATDWHKTPTFNWMGCWCL